MTIELVRDPTARVAALESRRVDVAVDVPIREAQRLGTVSGLASRIDPIADIMLLQITRNGGFADDRVRIAAHHVEAVFTSPHHPYTRELLAAAPPDDFGGPWPQA